MMMLLRYESGRRVEAVLLACNPWTMRVAIGDEDDTAELRFVDGCWVTDEGVSIEVESLLAIPDTDVSRFCANMQPAAGAAARAGTSA